MATKTALARIGFVLAALLFAATATLVPRQSCAQPGSTTAGFAATVPIEVLDGLILFEGRLTGENGRDTVGTLVLDTGAGRLAVDNGLAQILAIDSTSRAYDGISIGDRGLQRMTIGGLQLDQVAPVLVIDTDVITRVTDRKVLGVVGERAFSGFGIVLDYARRQMSWVPIAGGIDPDRVATTSPAERSARSQAAIGEHLSPDALPVFLVRAGDGKLVASGVVTDPRPPRMSKPLRLLVDTGATKTVFFEKRLWRQTLRSSEWRSLRGLSAPTLLGPVDARVVRVPRIDLMTATGTVASGEDVDAAVIDGPLGEALSREAGFPIDGLLGHSFLRRFRVVFDFVHTIMWLEPVAHDYDVRRYEYTHVGVQIERVDSLLVVSGVVEESPAAKAGIERGDELIEVDGRALDGLELIEVIELLEGPPQSGIHLLIRRDGVEHRFDLLREQLL